MIRPIATIIFASRMFSRAGIKINFANRMFSRAEIKNIFASIIFSKAEIKNNFAGRSFSRAGIKIIFAGRMFSRIGMKEIFVSKTILRAGIKETSAKFFQIPFLYIGFTVLILISKFGRQNKKKLKKWKMKMILSNQNINTIVNKALTSYENARGNQEILDKISFYGYTDEQISLEIQSVKDLFDKAQKQISLYGEFHELQNEFVIRFKEEHKRYMGYRKMARLNLIGKLLPFQETLRINQSVKQDFAGFIAQAKDLYTTLINRPTILEKLQSFGFTVEKMQEGLDKLQQLKELESRKTAVKGSTQRATKVRNEAYNEIQNRYFSFVTSAKICLEELPQLREVLGILERSVPIRKKETDENTDTT